MAALYKLTKWTEILKTATGEKIPRDLNNSDYRAYLQWLELGNTPDPADPPTAAELQLIQDGIDAAAARMHTKLNALKAMTPAQVQTWVTNNVTNLTQAQDAIATLAIGMSILARRI